MVRDLRDIFCSMEKNFRKSQEKSSPLVDHAKMTGTTTPKRIDIWSQSQPVGLAIDHFLDRGAEVVTLGVGADLDPDAA